MSPEIVYDGVMGLLFNDTPDNLARAIVELPEDRVLREKMGMNSRQSAISSFSLDKQLKTLECYYKTFMHS